MTSTLRKTAAAMLFAGVASVSSAQAGGTFSITVNPTDRQQAEVVRAGLAIYSLSNRFGKGGGIKQKGLGNIAGVLQNGFGNNAIVHQNGNGHNGTIQQTGNHNSYGLFQFGNAADGHVVQNGNGHTGATFQFGWK